MQSSSLWIGLFWFTAFLQLFLMQPIHIITQVLMRNLLMAFYSAHSQWHCCACSHVRAMTLGSKALYVCLCVCFVCTASSALFLHRFKVLQWQQHSIQINWHYGRTWRNSCFSQNTCFVDMLLFLFMNNAHQAWEALLGHLVLLEMYLVLARPNSYGRQFFIFFIYCLTGWEHM